MTQIKRDVAYAPVAFNPAGAQIGEVLEACGTGRFQNRLVLAAGLALMCDAMEVALLGYLTPCAAADWDLSSLSQGVLTASVFGGQFVGALMAGFVADVFGRKKSWALSTILVVVAGLLTAAATGYYSLLFFRILVGVGIGGMEIPFDLAAEFLGAKSRGRGMLWALTLWGIGSVYTAAASWLLMGKLGYSWRALALVAACPPGLMLLVIARVPESPRWLLVIGQVEEAQEVLHKAAHTNGITLPAFRLLKQEVTTRRGHYGELFRQGQAQTTVVLMCLSAGFGFSYYGIVLLISSLFETGESDSCSFSYGIVLASAAAELLGNLSGVAYVNHVGRRPAISANLTAAGVAGLLLSVLSASIGRWPLAMIARGTAIVATSFIWLANAELFPTDIRGIGHASCMAVTRVTAATASFWIEWTSAGTWVIGLTLLVVNLVCATIAWSIPVDTAGLELDFTRQQGAEGIPLVKDGALL